MAGERKQAILEALARELEDRPGGKVTTAGLARAVGVSEAALYRHFPSKARMYEGLISFAEDGVFSRINQIMEDDKETRQRCARVLYLLLGFAERNPGIVRLLLGDALVGEHERLHERIQVFFERLQTQFRQILREARLREDVVLSVSSEAAAETLVIYLEGRMRQFLRTRFAVSPLSNWETEWRLIDRGMFS
ncbi:nucleoid occlusion factor SlmA [Thiolapillus brandeum]|uniref:Nucleoid occlusion factor SlmA n=1 Tax=Thiolapillus brandeum TaxID=1076588 RepID=A0A7U6GHX3_9GAMM|nr:nucleoid occlusion factor SlmA [Thiolapillus brandeum]BAO43951.1 TetR/AcrR family transcriptional regulator [Thiolapillus brandeum]